jgi:hypothetical protein
VLFGLRAFICPIEIVAIRRQRLSKSKQTVRYRNVAKLCSDGQFTCSTNPLLPTAIDSDQRSSRPAMSPLDLLKRIHMRLLIVTTKGDVRDKAGYEARNDRWRPASRPLP